MNKEDFRFIDGTETCRSVSNFCIYLSILFLAAHELDFISSFLNWSPSSAPAIVFALLAIVFRITAIDRFLRICHQQDNE